MFEQSFMKVFSVVLKFVGKISKGHNSVKMLMELHFFLSVHCLMMVYICTKFHEIILDIIKVIEQTRFS